MSEGRTATAAKTDITLRNSEVSWCTAAPNRKEDTTSETKAKLWFFTVSTPLLLPVARAA
jgi:hypothetical protein